MEQVHRVLGNSVFDGFHGFLYVCSVYGGDVKH